MCKISIPENATLDEKRSLCFDALYNMNLGDKVEKKDNLSYLTWSEAWKAFKEVYPSATFRVITNPDTKLPYFVDGQIGIMVFTEVTADDLTQQCFLPVLNSSMKPMRLEAYNYTVYDKQNKRQIEKTCEERMDLFTRQMVRQEGVTEALKAADQMEWVRRMNSIRSRAEEIALSELVYC